MENVVHLSTSGGRPIEAQDQIPSRGILDVAPVSMAVIGPEGRLTYANLALAKMLGCKMENCGGMVLADVIHPEDITILSLHLSRLQRGESDHHSSECRIRAVDGSALWVGVSAVLLNDSTRPSPEIILQFADISRQKHAESVMSEGEGRLSYALDAARQGVWDLDLRAGTSYYSRMWREMRGIGPTEHVDSSMDGWLSRVHPDDRERLRALATKQNNGEVGYNIMEYRERHRDGHYIWILSRGKPVEWTADGEVIRTLGTDTDISSLKATEARLAEEKERLRITLHSIGDGVISTDMDGFITFMNPVAESMTGWQVDAATGRELQEVFVIANDETSDVGETSAILNLIKNGSLAAKEAFLSHCQGTRTAVRLTSSPVRDTDGKSVGLVLVFQDVTEHREIQRQLAHSASHDALTGLPNRKAFEQTLETAVNTAGFDGRRHVLCLADLDKFKIVNDTAGHAAGDALLMQVAETFRTTLRTVDFVARIGGDEFAIVLFDCSIDDAQVICNTLVSAMADIDFRWNENRFRIGVSLGLRAIDKDCGNVIELKEQADNACYLAKQAGGGCAVAETGERGRAAASARS